jgi:type I restriction enzyme S subunit
MSEFEYVSLSNLVEEIIDNRGRTCPTSEQGIPLIATNCVKEDRIYPTHEKVRYVSDETYAEWFRGHPIPGDILFVNKGSPGRVCLVPDPIDFCIAQDMVALRANKRLVYPQYLFAALRSPQVKASIDNMNVGTMIPHFKKGDFDKLLIPVPDRSEQESIGNIYYSFSLAIENKRKTNETLEAIAKALFKSWFVDFDPVRAKAEGRPTGLPAEISDLFPDSFEDSELGEIPSGWSISCVNDLCEWVSSGGTPSRSRKDFWENGSIPWFKTGELNDAPLLDSAEKINELALGNSSCKYWEAGTILFAIYASPTVGRLGVLTESGTSNQAAAGLKAKGVIGTPFLRRTLLFSRDELQNIAVGAAQQNINVQILKDHKVVAPGISLATVYSKTISPLDEQQICLAKSTRELCLLRDALLPKLISGELRIPDAEKMLENFLS